MINRTAAVAVAAVLVAGSVTGRLVSEGSVTGRLVSEEQTPAGMVIDQRRLLDTRTSVRATAGQVLTVNAAAGAERAFVNVTVVQPDAAGFLSVWAEGPNPGTSALNYVAGRNENNLVLTGLDADGSFQIVATTGTHLTVDLVAVEHGNMDHTTAPPTPTTASPPTTTPPVMGLDYNPRDFYTDTGTPRPVNPPGTGEAAFRMSCRGGHLSYNDPIVRPGVANSTHLHQFFGNLAIDENTTTENIRQSGETTCQGGPLNRSGYWVPALIDTFDDEIVPIDLVVVYYKGEAAPNINGDLAGVSALPRDLRMIADRFTWSCGGNVIGKDCSTLKLTVTFPYCWNGRDTDTVDHRSHMAHPFYSPQTGRLTCPTSHPVVLPRITYNVHYNLTGISNTENFRLSSDYDPKMTGLAAGSVAPGGSTAHADWFNGWNTIDAVTGETADRVWYHNCLVRFSDASFGQLCDGRELTWPAGGRAQPTTPAPSPLP